MYYRRATRNGINILGGLGIYLLSTSPYWKVIGSDTADLSNSELTKNEGMKFVFST